MIPNVFVSSTIQDLQHLRDAVRETLRDLSYFPVMSEYGDVGYLVSGNAEKSCYTTIRDCQLAVLIIGKRYGSLSDNDLSVTHNEFHSARDQNIPIITLVEAEVMSFKVVFDANKEKKIEQDFPGMDNPEKTFNLISEIMGSTQNNGILAFTSVSDARGHLSKQIAHLFRELLTRKFDPIKAQVVDVLSEVRTLRHELLKEKGDEPIRYLRATQFLLGEQHPRSVYGDIVKTVVGSIEEAIPLMLEAETFDKFIENANATIIVDNKFSGERTKMKDRKRSGSFIFDYENVKDKPKESIGNFLITTDKQVYVDNGAKIFCDQTHHEFINSLSS